MTAQGSAAATGGDAAWRRRLLRLRRRGALGRGGGADEVLKGLEGGLCSDLASKLAGDGDSDS